MAFQHEHQNPDRPPSGDHVSEELVDLYMRLRNSARREFTLVSCWVDGKKSVAIVEGTQERRDDWAGAVLKVREDGEDWYFYPWFVLPTSGMSVSFDPEDAKD